MEPNLEQTKEKAARLGLSPAEKHEMFAKLQTYMSANPTRDMRRRNFLWKHAMAYSLAGFLILGTGVTSFAAEGALPGEALYGVKTGVNETLVRILPLPAGAKAKVEITLIDRRMEELEKMIVRDIDTPEKVDIVLQKIDEHKDIFDQHLSLLTEAQEKQAVSDINSELETVVDAHIDVLEEITGSDADAGQGTKGGSTPEPENPLPATGTQSGADERLSPQNFAAGTTSDTAVMMMVAAQVPQDDRPIDPILEEITEFSETEIKPFVEAALEATTTDNPTSRIRMNLRNRILEKAERELDIDLGTADAASSGGQ